MAEPQGSKNDEPDVDNASKHPLHFGGQPPCMKHFRAGHKWWCRRCDREAERQMRDVVHALWELQGAGDRIVR